MTAIDPLAIDFASSSDVLKLYPETPLLSSDQAGWEGIQLQYHHHPPHHLVENYSKQHRIIIYDRSPSSPLVEEMIEHRFQTKQFNFGDVTFVPANVLNSAYWNTDYKFITLSFEPDTFARHTFELIDVANIEFVPSFSKPDSLIHSIGFALKSELERSGVGSRLYTDSLTAALMVHLVRHYSTLIDVVQTTSRILSRRQLQSVINFIDQHLDQELSLSELAAVAQISPSYFSALFKQSTDFSPHQFVIQRRIDRAKQLLKQGDLTIAEVAYSLGFSHQSHFSYHFKRLVGVSPKTFLKSS